jgi:hypothetical protein
MTATDPESHNITYTPTIVTGATFIKWASNSFEVDPKEAVHCGDFSVKVSVTDTNLTTDYSITVKVTNQLPFFTTVPSFID